MCGDGEAWRAMNVSCTLNEARGSEGEDLDLAARVAVAAATPCRAVAVISASSMRTAALARAESMFSSVISFRHWQTSCSSCAMLGATAMAVCSCRA